MSTSASMSALARPRARFDLWCLGGLLLAIGMIPGKALAWDLFRAENKDVKRGNELLERGKAEEATQAYEAAQRSLPNDPGVQLDKGLGLLGAGKLPEAREAFRAASQGNASPDLRGKANYNLGLTFLHEADALAKEEKLEEAQKLLTESVDAFKGSLRNVPKNRDAAWNLELAKRRLVDLQQKKQKQDQEKQDQEKKDQEDQEKKDPDQQNQDQQDPKDQQKQDPQQDKQDQQKQDSKDSKDGSDKQKQEEKDKAGQEQPKPPQPEKDSQTEQQEQQQQPPSQKALPEHMQRALDALSESDDNLQKQRARARARQRPQRIEKDW